MVRNELALNYKSAPEKYWLQLTVV